MTLANEADRAALLASGMTEGLEDSYALLDRLLPAHAPGRSDFRLVAVGDRQITITRSFAAPRATVYQAHTEATLLRRWMGSAEIPLDLCEMDPRPGGSYRYVWWMRDGTRVTLNGRIEAINPDQITATEVFDPDWTGGPASVVTRFSETAGQTSVTVTVTYATTPARDHVLGSGMGDGMAASYDLLDGML